MYKLQQILSYDFFIFLTYPEKSFKRIFLGLRTIFRKNKQQILYFLITKKYIIQI